MSGLAFVLSGDVDSIEDLTEVLLAARGELRATPTLGACVFYGKTAQWSLRVGDRATTPETSDDTAAAE